MMKPHSKRLKDFGLKSDTSCEWWWRRVDELTLLLQSLRKARFNALPSDCVSPTILDYEG